MIANGVLDDSNLTIVESYALIVLMRYYNPCKGYAYPSYKVLRSKLKVSSDKSVAGTLKSLEIKGFIKRVVRPGIGTQYFILKYMVDTPYKKVSTNQNASTGEDVSTREKVSQVLGKSTEHLLQKSKTIKTNTITKKKTINMHSEFFETIWNLYPNKKGKAKVSKSKIEELYKIGVDEIKRAIERYIKAKPDWQAYQNGSTFFNSGYVDYLDKNYTEANKPTDHYRRVD